MLCGAVLSRVSLWRSRVRLHTVVAMQLPLRANFADKSSQETVRGIIRVADDQSLELWKGWRYRTTTKTGPGIGE